MNLMINAYFDGGCGPTNPGGIMAYAVSISNNNQQMYTFSKLIPSHSHNSNNLAEYLGFQDILLTLVKSNLQASSITVFGDSNLVINQMFGTWRISDGHYVKAALECKSLLEKFSNIHGKWIPEKENKFCHELVMNKLKEGYRRGRI